jgi:hypothetical protein
VNPISPEVAVWAAMGVLVAATDLIMAWRRLSGRLGATVRAEYRDAMHRIGGARVMVTLSVVISLLVWPLSIVVFALAYHHDWRTYQAELQTRAFEKP